MMEPSILSIDVKPLLTEEILKKKKEWIAKAIKRGTLFATEFIIGQIQEKQLSGRIMEDFGLKRQSGDLRERSWKKNISNTALTITSKIWTISKYAKYHQTGTSRFPKRLYVLEYFKAEGEKIYLSEITEALHTT